MSSKRAIRREVPEAFMPLLQPARYKAAYGGRGGGKSHFFGEEIILEAFRRPLRWACIREVQNAIRDSVRQLLVDKIQKFGLEAFFTVNRDEIISHHGEPIIFKGMQSYNAGNIKSLEAFDGVWVEEAALFSERSLDMLIPTVRKPGSQLFFSWNPENDTDAVDKFFRGGHPPKDSVVQEVSWRDNPWLSEEMADERARMLAADPEKYEHVWEGGYNIVSEAAYYAKHIAAAEKEGRVGEFAYDPTLPVSTSWDLGIDDYTALWFFQNHGTHVVVVDFFETNNAGLDEICRTALPEICTEGRERYAALANLGRSKGYRYDRHYLPHDIKVRELGAGGKMRIEALFALGFPPSSINVGVPTAPDDRVEAARRLLPQVKFNRTPRISLGLRHLRSYKRRMHRELGIYMGPLKDGHDHAADAFGEYAINAPIIARPVEKPKLEPTPQELSQVRLPGRPAPRTRRKISV